MGAVGKQRQMIWTELKRRYWALLRQVDAEEALGAVDDLRRYPQKARPLSARVDVEALSAVNCNTYDETGSE